MALIKIGASLLSADFSRLGTEAKRAEKGGADFLHFDIMDGHFVPNITFGPATVKALRDKTSLPFYVHLMIQNPEKYIERFAEAGSDLLTVHAETCPNLEQILGQIGQKGVKAGIALNPETPLSSIEPILNKIDLLLIMTVEPGFGGQSFLPATLPKIKEAKERAQKSRITLEIGVDGGINKETAPLAVKAGANTL
ncbi:MAG: ribulose-phosphate 3-epimerase, partial [Candidatus Bathyarchaeia archaeon]